MWPLALCSAAPPTRSRLERFLMLKWVEEDLWNIFLQYLTERQLANSPVLLHRLWCWTWSLLSARATPACFTFKQWLKRLLLTLQNYQFWNVWPSRCSVLTVESGFRFDNSSWKALWSISMKVTIQALICLVDKKTGEKSKTRPRFIKQDQIAIAR